MSETPQTRRRARVLARAAAVTLTLVAWLGAASAGAPLAGVSLVGVALAGRPWVGAAPLTGTFFVGTASAAAPIGGLIVVPGESSDLAAIRVRTSAGCPAQADAYYATIHGRGLPQQGQVITANTAAGLSHTAGFDVYFALTMKDFADDNHIVLGGRYDITVLCIDSFSQQSYGEFTGSLQFSNPTRYEAIGAAKPVGPPPPPLPLSGGGPPAEQGAAPQPPAEGLPQQPAPVPAAAATPGQGQGRGLLPTALMVLAVALPLAAVLAYLGRRRTGAPADRKT